ncbi:hydrogenase/urease accessory protein [Xenococcus sp. PCC 7305]|uniref:HupE/UreJ family protein n=1 Tax=Xenococcus sp. PCC 7305 TaxID=102125 RepID=UPI0002ABC152|nr:HupE/UreJ family protein [Xenococcus sp. PCC 7305]ELS01614.1 hydrogenase/urease accessory protein [Xenococcus sp. PCC 7305]
MSSNKSYFQQLGLPLNLQWSKQVGIIAVLVSFLCAAPVLAHHPLGGKLPSNFFEGMMSGFGHPIIGFDHLAFVIASGLIAVGISRGLLIPIAFVIATGIGAVVHLQAINLPIPELVIAASVVLFGVLLVARQISKTDASYSLIIAGLAALAGIFHGHAYGEGIFGAEPTPLFAYLIGFVFIQLAISLGVYFVASRAIRFINLKYITRFAGLAIATTGLVFLSSAITG